MAIQTICAGCGRQLAVDDNYAGRTARCPACNHIYTVPFPNTPVEPLTGPTDGGVPLPPPPPGPGLSPTPPNPIGSEGATSFTNSTPDQFWMLASNQMQYGPVDRETLNRWFSEGRVGPDYRIRLGDQGDWLPADQFRPSAQPSVGAMPGATPVFATGNPYAESPVSANPYATSPYGIAQPGMPRSYPKADQSGIVLAMGILSWLVCPIFGVVAWIMGSIGLKDIANGQVDPTNKGLMQVGYYMGMIHIVLMLLACGAFSVFAALSSLG